MNKPRLGAAIATSKPSMKNITCKAVGWQVNYYFKSVMKNTWYLSTHLYYDNFTSFPHSSGARVEKEGARTNMALGYRWRGSYGLNFMAGLGSEHRDHAVAAYYKRSGEPYPNQNGDPRWVPFIEFKMGIEI